MASMSPDMIHLIIILAIVVFLVLIVPSSIRLRYFKMVVFGWTMIYTVFVLIPLYVFLRMSLSLVETAWLFLFRRRERRLRHQLAQAQSYQEWYSHATELDKLSGRDAWKKWPLSSSSEEEEEGKLTGDDVQASIRAAVDAAGVVDREYDWSYISGIMQDLQAARQNEDVLLAIALVQQCCRRNVAGIMNPDLYSHTFTGEPKRVVTDFVNEIVATMQWLTDYALDLAQNPTAAIQKLQQQAAAAAAAGVTPAAHAQSLPPHVEEEEEEETKEDISVEYAAPDNNLMNRKSTIRRNTTTTTNTSTIMEDVEHAFQNAQSMATLNLLGAMGGGGTNRDRISINHRRSSFAMSMTGMAGSAAAAAAAAAVAMSTIDDDESQNSSTAETSTTTAATTTTAGVVLDVETLIQELLGLFQRARINYGRTAVCLSGGANMALYHFGHVLGLLETGNLPNIFTGSSGGSIVAAFLCTRTDDELKRELHPAAAQLHTAFQRSWPQRLQSLWRNGYLFDDKDFYNCFRRLCNGDWTFEEAYKRTGRVLCISLSSTKKKVPPLLLNHITTPNVVITSAVTASCAFPVLIPKQKLQYKDADGYIRTFAGGNDQAYIDGSLQNDIPTDSLAETLNCRFFIVGQSNPHIAPFFYNANGAVGLPSLWSSIRAKDAHRGGSGTESWRGGFLVSAMEAYLKVQLKSNFHFLELLGEDNHLTQNFLGSVTLVPDLHLRHFAMLVETISASEFASMIQCGAVEAYRHAAILANHYKLADSLVECLARLESRHTKTRELKLNLRPVISLRQYEFVAPQPLPELNSELALQWHQKLVAEAEAAAAAESAAITRSIPPYINNNTNTNRISISRASGRSRRSSLLSLMADEDEYERDWVRSLDKTIHTSSATRVVVQQQDVLLPA